MEAKAASVDVGLATWWGPFEGVKGACLSRSFFHLQVKLVIKLLYN